MNNRHAGMVLPAAPEAPRQARRFLSEILMGWGRGDLAERALLAVSELVTNAYLHGQGEIRLVIGLGDTLRVEVHDSSPRQPSVRRYSALSATGRGLLLVEQLVDRWGTAGDPAAPGNGKLVWFELDARQAEHAGDADPHPLPSSERLPPRPARQQGAGSAGDHRRSRQYGLGAGGAALLRHRGGLT